MSVFQRVGAVLGVVAVGAVLLPGCNLPVPPIGPPGGKPEGCAAIGVDGTAPPSSAAASADTDTPPTDTVDVDLGHQLGPVNHNLTGVVWNTGAQVSPVAPVHPAEVRIDGSLQNLSPAQGQLDTTSLLAKIAQIRQIGAEPLVLLSYMPKWLGQPRATAAGGTDPTRMGPYDLDLWQDLVEQVVRAAATAPQPAYRFEVWNEPDLSGIFWDDTPDEFTAMAMRTIMAVEAVKQQTGLPLQVGGPASSSGLNTDMLNYISAVAKAGLPLDFVSWHKYANYPYLGPDGPEGNLPLPIYQKLAKRNPNNTPLQYSAEIADIKAKVATAIAGSNLSPRFEIDEWNVSSGGYDLRHDDAEGASLVAGILVEMERAGLGGADFYRAISSSSNTPGDWGLVYSDGTPKPSWWVFRAWSVIDGARLSTSGDDATTGLWARAAATSGCVSVLLSNFIATGAPARQVRVNLDGSLPKCRGPRTATLSKLDTTSTSLADATSVHLEPHQQVTVPMASQSVALLQVSC
jgi:hypothetical protein